MHSNFKIAGWITLGALTGALVTVQLQAVANNAATTSQLPLEQIQEFAAVYGIIRTAYVEPTDSAKLMQDAIAGMVSGLDPHSQYLGPEDYKEFRDSTSGRFVGVGIEITQEDGWVKIVSPIEDSPAYRAGLQSGDLITRIDDVEVRELTLQQAVQRMRGEPNTQVVLTIFRRSENRTFTVPIVRAEIHTQSVKARIVEPGYGWIRISQFQENTAATFAAKLNELYRQDPELRGLVLDLRNDPGGLLDSAIAVSAAFLPADTLIVSTRGQLPQSNFEFKANPRYYVRFGQADPMSLLPDEIKTIPLVVLVNEGSASASEIVAGALQDHNRATIMGATTFGKGSVQSIHELTPDTGIKLTTALYYTPSGHSIQATGIEPDIRLAENADGSSPLSALYTREADLQRHLVVNAEDNASTLQRQAEREDAMRRLQESIDENTLPRLPEFGSEDDFRLRQALNYLQGKPVEALPAEPVAEVADASANTSATVQTVPEQEEADTVEGITQRLLRPFQENREPVILENE